MKYQRPTSSTHNDECSHYAGGIIPSIFATNLTADKSLSYKLRKKKDSLLQYSSKHVNMYRTFCPDVVHSMLQNETKSTELKPITFSFFGACMVIDLTGFTRLSAELCGRGAEGLDELRRAIDSYFGSFVTIIRSFGGDVFSFAGDALICIFREWNSPVSDPVDMGPCRAALACAHRVNQHCNTKPGGLHTHTAITFGELFVSTVGGFSGSWTYVLNGRCLRGLSRCLGDATAGDVVLSESAYLNLNDDTVLLVVLESGNYKVLESSDTLWCQSRASGSSTACRWMGQTMQERVGPDVVRFIPRPVLEAISTDLLRGLSELRTVTTAFIRFDNYSFSCTQDISTLQSFYTVMQECLVEAGGFMRQFLVDDKGCVLIALWGVPTAYYSNNCSRSLICAVSMSQRAKTIGHTVSIGIATGVIYCGTVGSHDRQDYVAIGSTVNLAARLMGKANGRILLDMETFDHLPLEVSANLTALPAMQLKGFAQPCRCLAYTSDEPPPFVPRDTPSDSSIVIERYIYRSFSRVYSFLSSLSEDRLDGTTDYDDVNPLVNCGRPHFFCIKGSPGCGKTAIATHLSRRCRKMGCSVHYMKVLSSDDAIPYNVIRRLVIGLAGGQGKFICEQSQRNMIIPLLQRCFPHEDLLILAAQRFPYVKRVLRLQWSMSVKNEVTAADICMKENYTIARVLAQLLKENATIIVIDNAHFMCSESWAELTKLASLECRSVVVLTLRVDDVAPGMRKNSNDFATTSDDCNTMGCIDKSASKHVRSSLHRHMSDSGMRSEGTIYSHQLEYEDLVASVSPVSFSDLDLRPLNISSVRKLLITSLGDSAECDDILKSVYRISRGIPFWCWKIIKFIKNSDKRIVKFDYGVLLGCMLDKFTDAEKSVIKCASVIGEEFSVDILTCILAPFLVEELDDLLLSLLDGGMIYRLTDGVYSFQSPLIRQFVYSLIPPSDAASTHLLIAESIETVYSNELNTYTLSLSYHYSMCSGRERAKAWHFSSRAALLCLNTCRFSEGVSFVKNSLRFYANKKDIMSLIFITEAGICNIEDHMKEYTDSSSIPVSLEQSREKLVEIKQHLAATYSTIGVFTLWKMRIPLYFWIIELFHKRPRVFASG